LATVSARAPTPGRLAGNTLVTAVSQVVTMGLGAVLALIVLFAFGKTAKTDGLFTAYGVYGIMLMVAQSQRTTIVARLVEAPSLWDEFDRYVGAVLALALVVAAPLIALGGPLAHLLTGDASGDAHDTARTALWLFALAGAPPPSARSTALSPSARPISSRASHRSPASRSLPPPSMSPPSRWPSREARSSTRCSWRAACRAPAGDRTGG
jgi:hypothetical protein